MENEFFNFDAVIEIEKKKSYNQALDDFKVSLEKHQLENWIDNLEYGITFADVEMVIDELKNRILKEQSNDNR